MFPDVLYLYSVYLVKIFPINQKTYRQNTWKTIKRTRYKSNVLCSAKHITWPQCSKLRGTVSGYWFLGYFQEKHIQVAEMLSMNTHTNNHNDEEGRKKERKKENKLIYAGAIAEISGFLMLNQNVRHPYFGIWMHFKWKEQIIYIKWCAEISSVIDVLWWCVFNAEKEFILLRNWSATTCIILHVGLLYFSYMRLVIRLPYIK